MIKIKVDFDKFRSIITDVSDRQIPYAASRALNDVALALQESERESIKRNFILRRPEWTLQGVKIPKFTKKTDSPMSISVVMDEAAGRGDIMSKFESGGTKTPRGHHLAVPILARPSRMQIIPKDLRPRALALHAVGKSIRGNQGTFMLPLKGSGRFGIFQRRGKDIRLLYVLRGSAPLPSNLHFYDNASKPLIEELWELNFAERFAEAQRTAR